MEHFFDATDDPALDETFVDALEDMKDYTDPGVDVNSDLLVPSTDHDPYDGKSRLRYSHAPMNVNTDIVVPLPHKKVPQRDVKYHETFIPPETDTKVELIGKNESRNVESTEEPCPDVSDAGEDVPDLLPRTGGDTRTKYRTRGAVREEAKPTAKPR